MFIDRARIFVKAGKGGDGCESFYFRKSMRYRHRDGGDGGKGGDVIIKTDANVHTLLDFRYRQHFRAESGKHGSSNLKKGKEGDNCIILVPPGTIIRDLETSCIIRDLNRENESVCVVRGGKGGTGNSKNREATAGDPGREKIVSLELKLIADVGLIGYPNAGKSSFLNTISDANSKVAHFPFTTLSPVLGVVSLPSERRFVVADIPGIIKDAHKGKGLGIEFLRHIERTKLLLFIIDMAGVDGRDPCQDYKDLINEVECYDRNLLQRPHLIVVNKMDLPETKNNLKKFKKAVREDILSISCETGAGIEEVVDALARILSLD